MSDLQKQAWSEIAEERQRIMIAAMEPMHRGLLDVIRAREGISLLDAGCGSGELSAAALERGCKVNGIDLAPSMIELCRTRPALAKGEFREADLEHLPFADNTFDVAVASMSVHFCDNPKRALQELHRVVRPGGCLAMSCPASLMIETAIVFHVAKELVPADAYDTMRPFTWALEGALVAALADVGFARIEEHYVSCWLAAGSFEELFAKQLTWAPVRKAAKTVGDAVFLATYRQRLEERLGTPEPTRLEMPFRLVMGFKDA